MENLSKDLLFFIGTKLDLNDLINFCKMNNRTYNLLYNKDDIWTFKLINDFDIKYSRNKLTPREFYIIIYLIKGIEKIINQFKK
jgi:hypothetical protein